DGTGRIAARESNPGLAAGQCGPVEDHRTQGRPCPGEQRDSPIAGRQRRGLTEEISPAMSQGSAPFRLPRQNGNSRNEVENPGQNNPVQLFLDVLQAMPAVDKIPAPDRRNVGMTSSHSQWQYIIGQGATR